MHLSLITLAVLFLTGVVAGWVDSIAGGGGLITLPVLLTLGFSPADTLGTNKLQACFGSGGASWHYRAAGLVKFRKVLVGILFTAIGAAAGAWAVQQVHPDFLKTIIPFLLIVIALYALLRPQLGDFDRPPHLRENTFHVLFGLLIGFYDGFFGPGCGSFWAMAYVVFLGFNLTKATAHTKVMNFTSNILSLAAFAIGRHVIILPGIVMGLGQVLGTWLGARMVIRRGTKLIRPIFVMVVLAITIRLLFTR